MRLARGEKRSQIPRLGTAGRKAPQARGAGGHDRAAAQTLVLRNATFGYFCRVFGHYGREQRAAPGADGLRAIVDELVGGTAQKLLEHLARWLVTTEPAPERTRVVPAHGANACIRCLADTRRLRERELAQCQRAELGGDQSATRIGDDEHGGAAHVLGEPSLRVQKAPFVSGVKQRRAAAAADESNLAQKAHSGSHD